MAGLLYVELSRCPFKPDTLAGLSAKAIIGAGNLIDARTPNVVSTKLKAQASSDFLFNPLEETVNAFINAAC